MLRYTGHPIADIGVAAVAAFCEKTDPSSLSEQDLLKVAQFLEREYFSGKLLSYLTCVFPNAAYVQPGAQPGAKVKMKPESIERFKRQVLYAFQEPPDPEANGLRCVFSGQPANRVVYRQHVPMITGEGMGLRPHPDEEGTETRLRAFSCRFPLYFTTKSNSPEAFSYQGGMI